MARRQITPEPFAIYEGSSFRRYVRCASATLALRYARQYYGDNADATQRGPAFGPCASDDRFGYRSWNAPIVTEGDLEYVSA